MKNAYPLFILKELNVLSKYLIEKFGYEIVFESDWYIQLQNGNNQIGLMIENSTNQPEFLHKKFNGSGVILTVEVENVDEVYKDFQANEVIHPITSEEWGQRHFIIKAPEGLIIDVVNYTKPEDYDQ